jgi:hypothetical protein
MEYVSFAKFVKPSNTWVEVDFVELPKEVVTAHELGNSAGVANSNLPYFLKPVECLKRRDAVKLTGAFFNETSEQKCIHIGQIYWSTPKFSAKLVAIAVHCSLEDGPDLSGA